MPGTRVKKELGQHFTPRNVAALMLSMSRSDRDVPVLEPSSGAGVFLDLLEESGYRDVQGVEIDRRLAHHHSATVHHCSFLTFAPAQRFGLVIGNPPYIRWRDLSQEAREEMRRHPLYGQLFNSLSDYLTAFIAGSVALLDDGGELIVITPSFWMHTLHSGPLRDWLLRQGTVTDVVDFGEASVFPGVGSAIVIVRFVKGRDGAPHVSHHRYVGPRRLPEIRLSLDDPAMFEPRRVRPFTAGTHWTLATDEELAPVEGLRQACRRPAADGGVAGSHYRLGEFVRIANGMVSGRDRAFRLPEDLDGRLDPVEQAAVLRVTKAHQITPYVCSESVPYIRIPPGLTAQEAHHRFPVLMRHLSGFREELLLRYDYGRDLPFWEWAFPRSATFLLDGTAKGLVPCKERLTSRPLIRVALSRPGVVAVQDVTAFAPHTGVRESLEYVVAYLNHPWITEWVRRRGLVKGGVAEFSERPLSDIPFRPIDWSDPADAERHDRITALMRRMMDAGPARGPLAGRIEDLVASGFTGSR